MTYVEAENWEESSPWGRRSSRDNMSGTDHSPHSSPPHPSGWRRERNLGVKLSPGRREAEGVSKICFDFFIILLWFGWLYIKVTSLRWVCFAPGGHWWVISPCFYLNPQYFHVLFSLSGLWKGIDRVSLTGTWHPARVNPPTQVKSILIVNL